MLCGEHGAAQIDGHDVIPHLDGHGGDVAVAGGENTGDVEQHVESAVGGHGGGHQIPDRRFVAKVDVDSGRHVRPVLVVELPG
jgi:hypothetical protein